MKSKEELEGVITNYFETLFATDNPCDFEAATAGIETKVTEEMNRELLTEPSGEEVRVALFQMHPNKAPGMDGMHALFSRNFGILLVQMLYVLCRNGGEEKLIFQRPIKLALFSFLSAQIRSG